MFSKSDDQQEIGDFGQRVHRKERGGKTENSSCRASTKPHPNMTRIRSEESELRSLGLFEANDVNNWNGFLFLLRAWLG